MHNNKIPPPLIDRSPSEASWLKTLSPGLFGGKTGEQVLCEGVSRVDGEGIPVANERSGGLAGERGVTLFFIGRSHCTDRVLCRTTRKSIRPSPARFPRR